MNLFFFKKKKQKIHTLENIEKQNEYNIQLPPYETNSSVTGQSDFYLKYLSDNLKIDPPPSFSAFKAEIPNYHNLELEISDPDFYTKQLHNELGSHNDNKR